MLPLWRDQILIVIAPTHLSLLRLRGWFGKRQVIAKYSQRFTPAQDNQINWQPVLEALATCLKDPAWQKILSGAGKLAQAAGALTQNIGPVN